MNSLIEVNISNAPNISFRISDGAYITKNAPIEAPIMEAIPIVTTKDVISDFKEYILFRVCREFQKLKDAWSVFSMFTKL